MPKEDCISVFERLWETELLDVYNWNIKFVALRNGTENVDIQVAQQLCICKLAARFKVTMCQCREVRLVKEK